MINSKQDVNQLRYVPVIIQKNRINLDSYGILYCIKALTFLSLFLRV